MLLRAVLSHYRRHPLQLLALWLILTLATALWSGVWTLTGQARESMQAGDGQLSGREQLVRADGVPVTVTDYASLRRRGLCVFPWLQVDTGEGLGQVVGVDPLAMACLQEHEGISSGGEELALDGEPFVDISEAADLAAAGRPAHLRLYLASGPERGAEPVPEGWQRRRDPGSLSTGALSDSFLLNLDALGLLVVLVSALLIRSVYTLGLAQRRESLGLLERYGVTRQQLRRYLLLELVILAVAGAVPGYLLGLWLADALTAGFGVAMGSLFDSDLLATGQSPVGFLVTLAMVLLVVLWCGLDLLRGHAGHAAGRNRLPLGAVALAVGLVVLALASSLVMVFAGTALLLAGIGLMTPSLLGYCLSPAPASPPLTLWRRRELGVLIRRLALPLVALQLAAGTVIAIHALVSTFEGTFQQWLDQRLAGDLFVEVPEGLTLAPAADVLDALDAVEQWHPVVRGQAQVALSGAGQYRVDLMATDADSPLIRQWSLLSAVSEPWQALSNGEVLVNEQLARRQGLAPGSRLTLEVAGSLRQVRVAGVYADYGRPAGEVLVDVDDLPAGFVPGFRSLTIDLVDAGGGRQDVVSALADSWQLDDLSVRDNATVHRLANQVFQQTFALTRAISYLTLLLAGMALLMTGWVVLKSRSWYLGLLTAWGLSRRESRRVMLTLAAELLVGLWVAALPVGVALTWVLVDRINPVAFGWSLPMALYPGYWLELLVLFALVSLVVGGLASRGRAMAGAGAPLLEGGRER